MLTHNSSTKTQFYKFLIVMCCISLNMNFLQSVEKLKIFIIMIQKDLLFILSIKNVAFIPICHVKAVQDDISAKSVPI